MEIANVDPILFTCTPEGIVKRVFECFVSPGPTVIRTCSFHGEVVTMDLDVAMCCAGRKRLDCYDIPSTIVDACSQDLFDGSLFNIRDYGVVGKPHKNVRHIRDSIEQIRWATASDLLKDDNNSELVNYWLEWWQLTCETILLATIRHNGILPICDMILKSFECGGWLCGWSGSMYPTGTPVFYVPKESVT